MKAAWYTAIHDILPTNDRLYRIRISPTEKCNNCGMQDTVLRHLIECGEGQQIWQWTTQKTALILRTIPTRCCILLNVTVHVGINTVCSFFLSSRTVCN
jgi:hypothetical protein